jgi:hypothetical protein
MTRIARFVVLVAGLMSLFGTLSGSAGAVTWHNSGDTAFTATSGAVTLSSTGASLSCPSGGTMTASAASGPFVGVVWSAFTGTTTATGCTLGVSNYSFGCAYTFTATFQALPATTGTADMTCSWYFGGSQICHIEGSVSATYTNPSGSVKGRLAWATGGNLILTNGSAGTCPLGNGDRAHLSALTYLLTAGTGGGGNGPIITRTA